MKTRYILIITSVLITLGVLGTMGAGSPLGSKIAGVEKVFEKSLTLLPSSSSADTLLFETDAFSTDCDTLAFALEVYEADSAWVKSTSVTFSTDPVVTKKKPADSIYIDVKFQPLAPGNMAVDTATYTYLTSVMTKNYTVGLTQVSAKISPAAPYVKGKLWIKIHQAYTTTQKCKFRIWRIMKWLK